MYFAKLDLQQSSQLYFAPNCNLNCTVGYCEHQDHIKKEKHNFVDRKQVVEMIENAGNDLFGIDWQIFIKNIAKIFEKFKSQILELEIKIMNELKEKKIQYILGTQEPSVIRSALQISDNAKDHIYARCCDINAIYIALMENRQTIQYKMLKQIEKQTIDQIQKNLLCLADFMPEKLQQNKISEPIDFISCLDLGIKERIYKKITVDLVPSQLPNSRFDIHLKIIKVMKTFQINSIHKIIFLGGDQTGVSQCVMTDHPLIMENQAILITNCKVYLFKSTKQIQSNINSEIKKSDYPNFVNLQNNISGRKNFDYKVKRKTYVHDGYSQNACKKSQQQKQKMITEKTIQFLKPGDYDVTFTGLIIEFQEDCADFLRFWIGDKTGIVLVQLPLYFTSIVQINTVFQIRHSIVKMRNSNLIVTGGKDTKILTSKKSIPIVDRNNNMSSCQWVDSD